MTKTRDEHALCRQIYQGDETALEELIELYRHSLTAFINSFVHDYETAEEIMIDVFVDLIDKKRCTAANPVSKPSFSPSAETKPCAICAATSNPLLCFWTKWNPTR